MQIVTSWLSMLMNFHCTHNIDISANASSKVRIYLLYIAIHSHISPCVTKCAMSNGSDIYMAILTYSLHDSKTKICNTRHSSPGFSV